MTLPFFQLNQLDVLFLVFCRMSGILIAAPVFQTQRLPVQVRVALGAFLAILLVPLAGRPPVPEELFPFIMTAAREMIVGLGIGFVANLIFAAVAMAGEMADLQSGLALAALVDPSNEERTAIIGQFQLLMAWLVFFVTNGHQVLLRGMAQSLLILPLGQAGLPAGAPTGPLMLISRTFVVALQIGAPVLGSVLVTDLALGLLARSVPQMNLMVVGLPIKMLIAFGVLMLALPFLLAAERSLIPEMDRGIMQFLGYVAGGS